MAFPCIRIDGAAAPDQYVRIPLPGAGVYGATGAIELLVYAPVLPGVGGGWAMFMGGSSANVADLMGTFSHGGVVRGDGAVGGYFYTGTFTNTGLTVALLVSAATWHRLTYTFNGTTKELKIYVDGVLRESVTPAGSAYNALTHLFLGKVGGWFGPSEGDLYYSDVRIHSTIPSDAEILARAFTRISGPVAGLDRYYKCDEGAGATLTNSAGAGNDADIVNATWTTTASEPLDSVPGDPGAFVSPAAGGAVAGLLSAAWGAATGDADPITYDLELSTNGGADWLSLASGITATSWTGSVAGIVSANCQLRVRATDNDGSSSWVESGIFSIEAPGAAASRPFSGRYVAWVEVWSDVEVSSGLRLASIPNVHALGDILELQGRERLSLGAPWYLPPGPLDDVKAAPSDALWAHVLERRVLRVIFTDGSWEEWRILSYVAARTERGTLEGRIECESIPMDLNTGVTERVNADGSVEHGFSLFELTPAEHLDEILEMAPDHFVAGEVVPVDDVPELAYQETTPLGVLRALAEQLSHEIEVTRQVGGLYAVSIVEFQGSSADVVQIEGGHNLRSLRVEADATDQASRIYPLGQEVDGFRTNMGEARWIVAAADGVTGWITLESAPIAPIAFAGQLNGFYLEKAGTATRTVILDTDEALQRVQIAAGQVANFPVGQVVHVRRDNTGAQLTHLQDPAAVALLGVFPKFLYADDVPGVNNLVLNPFFDRLTGGQPDFWTALGAAVLTAVADGLHAKYGKYGIRVEMAADGEGIESDYVPIVPTEKRPFLSAQSNLWVVSGIVRFELVLDTPGGEVVMPPPGSPATTAVLGTFVEDLRVGGINAYEIGATRAKVRMVAHQGPAEIYMDAAQLTQTAGGADTLYQFQASNVLWRRALDALLERSLARKQYSITLADLYRLSPATFSPYQLVVGGAVDVRDRDLGVDVRLRVLGLQRNHLAPMETAIELGALPTSYLRALARRGGKAPKQIGRPASPFPYVKSITVTEPTPGTCRVVVAFEGQVVRWALWARIGEPPLDVDGEPVALYRRGPEVLTPATLQVEFPCIAGTWHFYVRAYAPDNRWDDEDAEEVLVGSGESSAPTTPSIAFDSAGTPGDTWTRYIKTSWIDTDAVNAVLVQMLVTNHLGATVTREAYVYPNTGKLESGDSDWATRNAVGGPFVVDQCIAFGWGTKVLPRVRYEDVDDGEDYPFSDYGAPFYITPQVAPTADSLVWAGGGNVSFDFTHHAFTGPGGADWYQGLLEFEVDQNDVVTTFLYSGAAISTKAIGAAEGYAFVSGDEVKVRVRYRGGANDVAGEAWSAQLTLTVP